MGDGNSRRTGGAVWSAVPARPRREAGRRTCDWKVSLLGNIDALAADRRPRRGVRRLHAAARAGRAARAVYLGDGKKHLSWDYLKALTPLALAVWYMDDGASPCDPRACRSAREGGSGRIEICVEAMAEGSRERLVEYLRDTYGLDVNWGRGARRKARARRSRRPPRHGSRSSSRRTCPRRWSTSCSRGSAAGASSSRSSCEPELGRARRGSSTSGSSRRPARCTGSTSRSRATTTTSSTGSWCTTAPRPPPVGGR